MKKEKTKIMMKDDNRYNTSNIMPRSQNKLQQETRKKTILEEKMQNYITLSGKCLMEKYL